MAKIFISYKRNVEPDTSIATWVYEALRRRHDVFMDTTIQVGERWAESIQKKIKESDYVIVFLTEQSVQSEMVVAEIEAAYRDGKQQGKPVILPVSLNYREALPDRLAAYINRAQWVSWEKDEDTPHLITTLEAMIAANPLPNISDNRESPGTRSRNNVSIYTEGGTVQAGGGIYIKRSADDQLLQFCRAGEFAFVLAPRQVGKSSLMVRTARQLESENIRVVIIDLSAIAFNVTQDEWYLGILNEISSSLKLKTDIFDWWQQSVSLGPVQRFADFLRTVMLAELQESVVLFFDEIDTTLSVPFSDDFFATLRAVYNARASTPEFRRLSFVVLGVATPNDLISDTKRTPFNIGRQVELNDFTLDEAVPLAQGLGGQSVQVLTWIYQFTNGHPYLTQRLCAYLAKSKASINQQDVSLAVERLFTGEGGMQDNNLQFVRDMLTLRSPNRTEVLRIYERVLNKESVRDDQRSQNIAHLKLSGVVKHGPQNLLQVRNQIYAQVFDRKWVRAQLPALSFLNFQRSRDPDEATLNNDDLAQSQDATLSAPEDAIAVGNIVVDETSSVPEDAAIVDTVPEPIVEEDEVEREARLQAVITANILARNRAQAVFNDRAQGDDQLGIKEEVEALAETLLLRDVEPPVAVGIMGGWGSGKSFVMYLISRYVEETRARKIEKGWPDTRKVRDLEIPAYVGHIYQINFNAWTYAKSNLWASLMDTIFSCLNRQMQLERLFAHQEIEAKDLPTSEWNQEQKAGFKARVAEGMLKGGAIFKKIYQEDYQIALDADLSTEPRERLTFWSERLLNHNLLWQVLRNQNEQALEKIREDEKELEKEKARRDALDQARQTEKVSGTVLDKRIAEPAYFALLQETLLRFLADAANTAVDQELKNQRIDKKDLMDLEKNAEKAVKGTQGIIHAFRQSRYYWMAGLSVAVLTFVLSVIWARLEQPLLQQFIARSVALVAAITPIIPTILARWQKIVDFELQTKEAFEKGYEAQQSRRAEEIAAENSPFEEKVRKLKAEIEKGSLPASNVLIRMRENQIEQQRLRIGPAAKYSNLLEFVQSRLDAATYENQLGLMHQVRRDIDELTYSLVNSANQDIFPRGKPRVILYIDDLDRCPPSRVVEILEAVQLLLNTKLFVVILGLDTRYVTRALEKEYKEILQHEGDPSGLDYIEKIIQIPYRVRPIERESLQKYLAVQMDVEKAPEPDPVVQPASETQEEPAPNIPPIEMLIGEPPSQTSQAEMPVPAPTETDVQTQAVTAEQVLEIVNPQETEAQPQTLAPVIEPQMDPGEQAPMAADTGQAVPVEQTIIPADEEPQPDSPELVPSLVEGAKPEISEKPPEPEAKTEEIKPLEIELPPAVIQFKHEDLLDLTSCCQQIPLSPRSIKRLVNVFKLMKIFWFRADKEAGLAERDRPRPVKQAAMCLLALSSAYPEVMREVFVHLESLYRQGQEHTRLLSALSNIKLPPGSANELAWQLQRYKRDISTLKSMPGDARGTLDQLTLGQLKFSTFNITRSFSFVGDPVYWTDDEEEKAGMNGRTPVRRFTRVNRN